MYTGIDCESHSQLLTTFHLTLNYSLILTHARRSDQTAGPNHIDVRGNNCMSEQMSGVVNQRVNECPPPAKIMGEQMSG